MRKMFVPTENFIRFTETVEAVEQRGAMEAGMLLVHGEVGRGKSFVVEHWALENGAVFLRANVDWTPKYFLKELAKTLVVDSRGTAQQLFERVLEKVAERQCPIVIDESEFTLRNNAEVAEKIRDISDRAENIVVLIGMDRIRQMIARHKQLSRRIAQVVEFKGISPADVGHACSKLAEVTIQPALCAEIYTLAKGRMSEVLNIIANVERIAKLSGLPIIDVADVQGLPLSYDWINGKASGIGKARKEAA